jgi:hypothetical protein
MRISIGTGPGIRTRFDKIAQRIGSEHRPCKTRLSAAIVRQAFVYKKTHLSCFRYHKKYHIFFWTLLDSWLPSWANEPTVGGPG